MGKVLGHFVLLAVVLAISATLWWGAVSAVFHFVSPPEGLGLPLPVACAMVVLPPLLFALFCTVKVWRMPPSTRTTVKSSSTASHDLSSQTVSRVNSYGEMKVGSSSTDSYGRY